MRADRLGPYTGRRTNLAYWLGWCSILDGWQTGKIGMSISLMCITWCPSLYFIFIPHLPVIIRRYLLSRIYIPTSNVQDRPFYFSHHSTLWYGSFTFGELLNSAKCGFLRVYFPISSLSSVCISFPITRLTCFESSQERERSWLCLLMHGGCCLRELIFLAGC